MQPQFNNDIDKRAYYKQLRDYHYPNVTPQITDAVDDPLNRPFVASELAKVPDEFHPTLLQEYQDRSADGSTSTANKILRESIAEAFSGGCLSLTATNDDINNYAETKSKMILEMLSTQGITNAESIIQLIDDACIRSGITPPKQKTLMSKIERARDPKWWRRRLKKDLMQRRESGAITMGFVHSKAQLYISNFGLERYRQNVRRSLEFLQNTEVVNEDGEIVNLEAVFNSSVSNPEKRFMETVVRVNGLEEYAEQLGLIGVFTTHTCPSRMHARYKKSGRRNNKYDGTTPNEAHQYLGKQWQKARAALKRDGIDMLFFRVVEPHHDGTPHWHNLIFIKPEQKGRLVEVLQQYALEHHGTERGAKESRFKYEAIDPKLGSAIGYVIKYIAKGLHGKGVGIDYESNGEDATVTVERSTAWLRTWGIRQYQFSEHCPVTIYRELRKVRSLPAIESMHSHWLAADSGDFCGFIKAMVHAPLMLVTETQQSTRYPDEQLEVIRGVKLGDDYLETRTHQWVLRSKDSSAVPWTCVNNCTQHVPETEKTIELSTEEKAFIKIRRLESEKPPFCLVDFEAKQYISDQLKGNHAQNKH